jgi:hypothetical protein
VFRRRRRDPPSDESEAFLRVLSAVESAKEAIVSAVPSPRGRARPLADALIEFETGLRDAETRMRSWRSDGVEELRSTCSSGLSEALRRAEELRLEAPELTYESLLARIGELIDPLEPFQEAALRLRRRSR